MYERHSWIRQCKSQKFDAMINPRLTRPQPPKSDIAPWSPSTSFWHVTGLGGLTGGLNLKDGLTTTPPRGEKPSFRCHVLALVSRGRSSHLGWQTRNDCLQDFPESAFQLHVLLERRKRLFSEAKIPASSAEFLLGCCQEYLWILLDLKTWNRPIMAERKRDHSRPQMWLARLKHDREDCELDRTSFGSARYPFTRSWDVVGRLYCRAYPPMGERILLSALEPWGNTLTTN